MTDITVHWPAVISLRGDDELLYLENQHEWDGDEGLSHHQFELEDRMIDSQGNIFRLVTEHSGGSCRILAYGEQCSVEEFCDLLKAHYLNLGQCCVPKFHINSFAEGMQMLQQSVD